MSALMKEEAQVCFRFLQEDEYYKIEDLFNQYNSPLPKPSLSRIAIAEIEETGEILGFFVLQLKPHAEPLWISPNHRNGKLWIKLAAMLAPLTDRADTFIIAENPDTIAMCEALGLKQVTSPVFVKEKEE